MLRISKATHDYAGRTLHAGDKFDVEDDHVVILLALNLIEPEEDIEQFQQSIGNAQRGIESQVYGTRDMQAARPKTARRIS